MGELIHNLRGLSVLVVEDEVDARELLGFLFKGAGANVYMADTAAAALAILAVHTPDVVISDIAMPDQDGYSLLRRVRSLDHEAKRTMPAIALTAFSREVDRERALDAGFDLHMSKPFQAPDLIQAVHQLIHERRTSIAE
jgi:CheY-like chemotaxis protein